jgi:hypothetical protein
MKEKIKTVFYAITLVSVLVASICIISDSNLTHRVVSRYQVPKHVVRVVASKSVKSLTHNMASR